MIEFLKNPKIQDFLAKRGRISLVNFNSDTKVIILDLSNLDSNKQIRLALDLTELDSTSNPSECFLVRLQQLLDQLLTD